MLKRSVIEQYHRYGYAILPYKLHSTVLNELNNAYHEIQSIAESNKNIQYTPQYDLDSNGNLCKIKRPHQWHHTFKSLLYNPFITSIANNLLNDPLTSPKERLVDTTNCGIRYQGFKFNIKPPYNGQSTILHQDFAYYPHSNDYLCTISIPLVDMSLENGTLVFIPESHLAMDSIYSHHYNNEFIGGISELPNGKNMNDFDIHSIECSAGDIIVHHTRIMHGSVVNKSDAPRPVLLMQYAANDSWPLAQNAKGSFGYELPNDNTLDEWDLYESTIITGKPTYYPFMKHIPFSLPLPWPKRNTFGSVYDQQSKVIDAQNVDLINQINYNQVTVVKNNHSDDVIISPPLLPTVCSKKQINAIYNLKHSNDLWKRLVYFVSIGPFGLLQNEKYNDLRLELENVFINATENNKYDDVIYDIVYKYFHSNIMSDERFKNKLTRFNHYNNRVEKRSNEMVNILQSINVNNKNCVSNILDVGCGDGLITIDIAKKLDIANENIYGCDIEKHENIHKDIKFNETINRNLFGENYFDLVICLMSIHHIKNQKELFDEIYAILKPNGILIIREHDCYIEEISVLLDIVHGFHCRVWSEIGQKHYRLNFFNEFESFYQSHNQWNMTLTSCGFKKHHISPIYFNEERDVKNVFFGMYSK